MTEIFAETRNRFDFANVWTQNGKILFSKVNRIKVYFDQLRVKIAIGRCSLKIDNMPFYFYMKER